VYQILYKFLCIKFCINFRTKFVYQITRKSEEKMWKVTAEIHLRPSVKNDSHWADFHDIWMIYFCRKFAYQISWKSDELISDMSRTGGQVTSPRKTSYIANTSPNLRTTFHPLLRDHPLSSPSTQNYACTCFLILLRGQSWINIKRFKPYISVQFATSYAAGQPKDSFLPYTAASV